MATPATPRLTFVRGDDETVVLYIDSDAAETPVNITGRTYTMSIGTGTGAAVLTAAGSVTGATGLAQFAFTDTQTATLTGSSYTYDVVQVTGAEESTLLLGPLSVLTRVTA